MAIIEQITTIVNLHKLPALALASSFCIFLLSKLLEQNRRDENEAPKGCGLVAKYWQWDPVWGIDLVISQVRAIRGHRFLSWLSNLYGSMAVKTFSINMFGTKWIYITEPEILKAVYATNFKDFGVTPIAAFRKGLVPFADKGAITTDGEEWEHSRLLIKPFFDRQLLPDTGETVDVQPLLQRWFLDIATEFIFSNSMNALVHPERSRIADTMLDVLDGGRLRAQMHQVMWLRNWDWWLKAVQEVHDFVNPQIEDTLRQIDERDHNVKNGLPAGPERQDLLWSMALMEKDQEQLRSHLCLILIANIDTTSIFISNCIWWLSRHPEAWEKLRREVLGHGDTPLTFETLRNMKYLNCVMNETHRIIPNNISQLRGCMNDTVVPLGGGPDGKLPMLVRKGDLVLINKNVMYRDPEYWGDDADKYRPDRFEGHRGSWHFLPFGGGPRRCPAQMMVQTEAGYLLSSLAKVSRRIEARDPNPYTPVLRIGASNKTGVKIALFK
ncbi:cytochrome p450 52a13 [Colletotrichum incanum]|uniref:Cytochrome p450 52a13 n=1 Tax=Colletotrichum incanum TaxID=1573173 RepID=A0A167D1Q1_COLIC|nr:cytochrome p450 52a13 [Colletotrichum incanum]OHW96129.1 cytochrome p450 [Colletotrichum incanum]